jgi:hypothetical protein
VLLEENEAVVLCHQADTGHEEQFVDVALDIGAAVYVVMKGDQARVDDAVTKVDAVPPSSPERTSRAASVVCWTRRSSVAAMSP